MIFHKELTHKIGAIICWLYAVVWVVAWFDPPSALKTMFDFDLHYPIGRYVPPMWTALLFAAAPIMRRDTRSSQILVSGGILATISSGLWEALQGRVLLEDAMVWLIVPLGIAVWVFGPALSASEAAALPPHIRRPNPMSLRQTLIFGVGVIFAVVGIYAGDFILNLGFGDIVIPRYAAITLGLCCIAGALVAWKFGLKGGGRGSSTRKTARPLAKPTILVSASPQGGFRWSVIIDGQTVGTGERATELEARHAADAIVPRLEPPEAP